MKALLALLFSLALLTCPSPVHQSVLGQGLNMASGPAQGEPPVIEEVRFKKWPETVGGVVEGYALVKDPDGDLANVLVVFKLTDEWAEGVPAGERVRTFEAERNHNRPSRFDFHVDTDGWVPGAYKVLVIAVDLANNTDTYIHNELLRLRLEISPPEEAMTWIYVGLGLLSVLISVMALAFKEALERKSYLRPPQPVYPEIY